MEINFFNYSIELKNSYSSSTILIRNPNHTPLCLKPYTQLVKRAVPEPELRSSPNSLTAIYISHHILTIQLVEQSLIALPFPCLASYLI